MKTIEHYAVDQSVAIAYDRTIALPPDEVTIRHGKFVSYALEHQRAAEVLYGLPCEPDRARRILDLGTGVGSFLVAAIAGHQSRNFELACVGVDVDPGVREFADENVQSAIEQAVNRDADLRISATVLTGDWNDEQLWDGLGSFDWIYCNPPYLTPDQPLLPGYESVPREHVYTDDITSMYQTILRHGISRLNPLGTLEARLSSKDFSRGNELFKNLNVPNAAENRSFMINQSWQPYAPDRNGVIVSITRTNEYVSPHGDPRVMTYVDTDIDIAQQ